MKPLTDNMKARLRLLYRRSRMKEKEEDGSVILENQTTCRFDRFLENRGLIELSDPQKSNHDLILWTIKVTEEGLRIGKIARLEYALTTLERRKQAVQVELDVVNSEIEEYEKTIQHLTAGETT